jgi:predicted ABC-type ATPase
MRFSGASSTEAPSAAWLEGKRLLERAIAEGGNLAFETTLGGATITKLLARAIDAGIDVHIWYVAPNATSGGATTRAGTT